MSTTRSQKRRDNQQESTEKVSEGLVLPIVVENPCSLNRDISVAGPSKSKSPRIRNSLLESLRGKTGENIRENIEEETENEPRSFYNPMSSVRINLTQNDDPNASLNTTNKVYGVNFPKNFILA